MHPPPPFHRRILPWVFVALFCAAAPALVFYTAGYRWNPNKDKVERNGTLIIDSQPSGAQVFLNGNRVKDTTPVTLQNTTPGRYLIRVEKNGYSAWQKYLDVRPEYVTFANRIWLWKITEPLFLHTASATVSVSLPSTPLAPQTDIRLQHVSETTALVLFQKSYPDTGFILPPGNWSVTARIPHHIILRDGEEWLSVEQNSPSPEFHRAHGDKLRAFEAGSTIQYLLIQGSEVWLWNPSTEPTLLLRDSEPIIQAAWHQSGENILVATAHAVSVLNLDTRDGQLRTHLADFDHIKDMSLLNNKIMVTGTKNGQTGVWSLEIE